MAKVFATRDVTGYNSAVIKTIRHKGLRALYQTGSTKGVEAGIAKRLRLILARLDVAQSSADMNVAGLRLHPLRGELKGYWAVTASGNWRIIFRFDGRDVTDVDLIDYH